MRQFHPLTVVGKTSETRDSVRLALAVPSALRPAFEFLPGQHLPVRCSLAGTELRRTYSICSAPGSWPLEIGVRVQPGGAFSEFARDELKVGDALDVMPPFGQFHANIDSAGARRMHLAFAAGSGITPVLSIISAILSTEPESQVCLFYGNRRQATTMFIDDLYALKNRYPDRLQLHFVFSREEQEFSIAAGRLDADKVRELWHAFCTDMPIDEVYVCGPDTMIDSVRGALVELGVAPGHIHAERFGVPRKRQSKAPLPVADGSVANVTVIMDGHKKRFTMEASDENIVDAAAQHGIELPFSCKGGVCATCRCHLQSGRVDMAVNYGLEPWELEQGFILACQSRPVSDELVLDYDRA